MTRTALRLAHTQYWDAHASTVAVLPALVLLDAAACPRGLAAADFCRLLGRLTDLASWQVWDLWDSLDVQRCGHVSCSRQ